MKNVLITNDYDWPHRAGRRPGCMSKNHGAGCYGTLWQCPTCKKWLCCAEGSDDARRNVCDSCAAEFEAILRGAK